MIEEKSSWNKCGYGVERSTMCDSRARVNYKTMIYVNWGKGKGGEEMNPYSFTPEEYNLIHVYANLMQCKFMLIKW